MKNQILRTLIHLALVPFLSCEVSQNTSHYQTPKIESTTYHNYRVKYEFGDTIQSDLSSIYKEFYNDDYIYFKNSFIDFTKGLTKPDTIINNVFKVEKGLNKYYVISEGDTMLVVVWKDSLKYEYFYDEPTKPFQIYKYDSKGNLTDLLFNNKYFNSYTRVLPIEINDEGLYISSYQYKYELDENDLRAFKLESPDFTKLVLTDPIIQLVKYSYTYY